jgi:amphi-Trp domain-containing protein
MATRVKRRKRDVERAYPARQFVQKLRRLADAIEQGKRFRIQVGGERISIPAHATITVEHERGKDEEEVELQLKWPLE